MGWAGPSWDSLRRGQVAQSASMPWWDGPLVGLVERDQLHCRGPHEGSATTGGRRELGLRPLQNTVPEGSRKDQMAGWSFLFAWKRGNRVCP